MDKAIDAVITWIARHPIASALAFMVAWSV